MLPVRKATIAASSSSNLDSNSFRIQRGASQQLNSRSAPQRTINTTASCRSNRSTNNSSHSRMSGSVTPTSGPRSNCPWQRTAVLSQMRNCVRSRQAPSTVTSTGSGTLNQLVASEEAVVGPQRLVRPTLRGSMRPTSSATRSRGTTQMRTQGTSSCMASTNESQSKVRR